MAKISINDIIDEVDMAAEYRRNKINSLAADIEDLEQQINDADAAATEAAHSGDIAEYQTAARKREDLKDALYVAKSQQDNLKISPAVDLDTLADAWAQYSADYNKRAEKAHAKLDDLAREFFNAYKAAVDAQEEMLKIRNRFGTYSGKPAEAWERVYPAKMLVCMNGNDSWSLPKVGSLMVRDPYAVFYVSLYGSKYRIITGLDRANDLEIRRVDTVVGAKMPYSSMR